MTQFYAILFVMLILAAMGALLIYNETSYDDDEYDYEGENDQ